MKNDIENHAKALEQAAASMVAAGVGADPKTGHAATLLALAADLRAQSQLGRRPTVFESFSAVATNAVDASSRQSHHLTLVQAVASAAKDDATLTRLANLRLRCARLGLDLDLTADTPLKITTVDAAFEKGSGSISDKLAVKSALFREKLLSASGL